MAQDNLINYTTRCTSSDEGSDDGGSVITASCSAGIYCHPNSLGDIVIGNNNNAMLVSDVSMASLTLGENSILQII